MESKYSRMHFNKCISINGYIIFTVERIMTDNQSDPVIQRLDRLERENWYWKRATLLLLIVIGTAALWSIKYAPILIGQGVVNTSLPTDKQGYVWIPYIKTSVIKAAVIDEV